MNRALRRDSAASVVDEQSARTFEGLRNLVAKVTPWLIEVGSWIFGGLTAINLVVISALITVGPVATAIKISTAALAAALPLNVRNSPAQAHQGPERGQHRWADATGVSGCRLPTHRRAYFPAPRERAIQHARRSRVALLYSMGIAALSIALTVAGIAAALWHLGQWIALVLVSSVVLSAALVTIAIAQGLPPQSDAEKRLKRILSIRMHRDRGRQ